MLSPTGAMRALAPAFLVGLAALAATPGAAAMSSAPPSKAEAQARYGPTLRNREGVKARHVCPVRSYYFDDRGHRQTTESPCTRQFAPLRVRSGELLSLRTARAATRVDLTPLDELGDFEIGMEQGTCRLRYRGVWSCRMPVTYAGDGSLRMSIAYPKARSNWTADISVVSRKH